MKKLRIIIFAKTPLPGVAKTRLIPALGEERSAELAQRMLSHSLKEALAANVGIVELCVSPDKNHNIWNQLSIPKDTLITEQGQGDLGQRMAGASKKALQKNTSVLLMGSDCPALNRERIIAAAKSLEDDDACMVPVNDGGYALLGLNDFSESYFLDIPWSTARVAEITKYRFEILGKTIALLPCLYDIDDPDDLQWLPKSWLNEVN